MNNCSNIYMLHGMQFCKYPDFYCSYKGQTKTMSIMINKMLNSGKVTCCNLNLYKFQDEKVEVTQSELEELIEEVFDGE